MTWEILYKIISQVFFAFCELTTFWLFKLKAFPRRPLRNGLSKSIQLRQSSRKIVFTQDDNKQVFHYHALTNLK